MLAQMSNATTRNMKKKNSLEIRGPGILFDFVSGGGATMSTNSGGNAVCILCFYGNHGSDGDIKVAMIVMLIPSIISLPLDILLCCRRLIASSSPHGKFDPE